MTVTETLMDQRREQAADERGLPASYARAMLAFDRPCANCNQPAAVVDGSGIGLCTHHRQQQATAIEQRERIRRAIEIARNEAAKWM
jgi:hypothetical protein